LYLVQWLYDAITVHYHPIPPNIIIDVEFMLMVETVYS
jgi:hypothetical protein